MSRDISIYYYAAGSDQRTKVEVPGHVRLFGGQQSSKHFWSLPRIREIGIVRLADLGVTDPVCFHGWDGLATFRHEITLLDTHLPNIDFLTEAKAAWLCNLIYCYHALVAAAPKDSEPSVMIG